MQPMTRGRLAAFAFLLLPLPCLAYGGFPPDATDGQLLGGLAGRLAIGLPLIALPWIAGSFLAERCRGAALLAVGAGTTILAWALVGPQLVEMGEFGYPHLVVPILGKGFLAFQVYFAAKIVWVLVRRPAPEPPPAAA